MLFRVLRLRVLTGYPLPMWCFQNDNGFLSARAGQFSLDIVFLNTAAGRSFQQKMASDGLRFAENSVPQLMLEEHDGHVFIDVDMDLRYLVLGQPFQHMRHHPTFPDPALKHRFNSRTKVWRCCSKSRFRYKPTRCNINNEVLASSDMTSIHVLIQA